MIKLAGLGFDDTSVPPQDAQDRKDRNDERNRKLLILHQESVKKRRNKVIDKEPNKKSDKPIEEVKLDEKPITQKPVAEKIPPPKTIKSQEAIVSVEDKIEPIEKTKLKPLEVFETGLGSLPGLKMPQAVVSVDSEIQNVEKTNINKPPSTALSVLPAPKETKESVDKVQTLGIANHKVGKIDSIRESFSLNRNNSNVISSVKSLESLGAFKGKPHMGIFAILGNASWETDRFKSANLFVPIKPHSFATTYGQLGLFHFVGPRRKEMLLRYFGNVPISSFFNKQPITIGDLLKKENITKQDMLNIQRAVNLQKGSKEKIINASISYMIAEINGEVPERISGLNPENRVILQDILYGRSKLTWKEQVEKFSSLYERAGDNPGNRINSTYHVWKHLNGGKK